MGITTLDYILNKFNLSNELPKHMPIEVPNFGRDQLAELFRELGFTQGVEIGVKEGDYSEILCKANPDLHLYSIDPWMAVAYFEHGEPSIKGDGIATSQSVYDNYYETTKSCLAKYPNCKIIRATSHYAVDDFKDASLDFVYIDGNHDFEHCTQDICEWSRKVHSGGIISGHDYTIYRQEARIHVKFVIDAYTRAYAIRPWFVLGAQEAHVKGIIRDKPRSWMWVKI